MEILEAFDLTGTLRGAAELAGCDHKTVAHWVRARDEAGGGLPVSVRPRPRVDAFAEKIEEWVDRSRGQDPRRRRASAAGRDGLSGFGAHDAPGGRGGQAALAGRARAPDAAVGDRAGAVDAVGLRRRARRSRAARRCCSAPGWRGRASGWCCALWDRTMPSVVMALDRALRAFGGAPTYALTDNERTVSIDHVCGIAVRNPQIVSVGRHYGLTIATCVPADPQSKGGSEATVRIAKADLVPTEHNLRGEYEDFAELERGVRGVLRPRQHARAPDHAPGAGGDARRGARAAAPAAGGAAHGLLRPDAQGVLAVDDPVGGALYSVPSTLVDERVWARVDGDELVVVHADAPDGPREVARHELTTPGRPSIHDEHYPPRPAGRAGAPAASAARADEQAFLAIGPGAERVADRRRGRRRRRGCGASSPRPSRSPSCTAPRRRRRGARRRRGRRPLRRRRPGGDPRAPRRAR